MSYDISIKGDQNCTKTTEQQPLIKFLVDDLCFLPDSETHFRIVDRSGLNYGDVDLSAKYQGEAVPAVNCIQIHIPYAYAPQKLTAALDLCRQIANYLGWLIYDEQDGRYIV